MKPFVHIKASYYKLFLSKILVFILRMVYISIENQIT